MKSIKIFFGAMAAVAVVTLSSAFVAPTESRNLTIEKFDRQSLSIQLFDAQLKGLHALLPTPYDQQLARSYADFRQQILSGKENFTVEGIQVHLTQQTDGQTLCTLSGNFAPFGQHTVSVQIGSKEAFVAWMDEIVTR